MLIGPLPPCSSGLSYREMGRLVRFRVSLRERVERDSICLLSIGIRWRLIVNSVPLGGAVSKSMVSGLSGKVVLRRISFS